MNNNDYYRHPSHPRGGIRNQTLGDPKTIKKFWSLAEISRFLNILVGCIH